MKTLRIFTENYSGYSGDITFYPYTGGTINIGLQVLPYDYNTDYYYGTYEIYFSGFNKTCILDYPLPTPTPTPTNTVTPTVTPTITPTNTLTPTVTPTVTPTTFVCSGIPYNLSDIADYPLSGNTLFFNFNSGEVSNNPDGIGDVYFNSIDFNGNDQTTYFDNLVGNDFIINFCQNNVYSSYSGSTNTFQKENFGSPYGILYYSGIDLFQIVSANTLFNFNEIVYINFEQIIPISPTPTNTVTPTPTPTNTVIPSQTVTYSASTDIIANPERGLQKFSKNINSLGDYSFVNQSTLITNRTGVDKITVLYRYIMLSGYMNTDTIDNTYLTNVQTDFNRIRNAGIKVILRISYNNDTIVNTQPLKSRIISHIQGLSTVFNNNKDIILSIQSGSIGKYGEWYYTDGSIEFGDEGSISPSQWLNRKDVVDAMLTNFQDVPIQVRYADAKIQMYGSTLITDGTAYQNTPLARVGFYNDALLNDYGDQGTYSIGSQCTNPTGVTEYNFISNAGKYLPMTGEPNGLNPCDGGYRTSGFNAVYEFNLLNFSIINRDYEPNVWQGWIDQGYYDEILRNLGYRLQLVSSTLSGSNLSLVINNVGYSKILFEKKTYIIYRDNLNNEYKRLLPLDIRTLNKGTNTVNITLPNDVPSNSYSLLLQITDKSNTLENTVAYCIQLANTGLWEPSTGYNNLQQTVVVP